MKNYEIIFLSQKIVLLMHTLRKILELGNYFRKRASDMRMMAQHKYGIQIKKIESWENYFDKLGRACVALEMLSNKAQKPIKITLNDTQTANKGLLKKIDA